MSNTVKDQPAGYTRPNQQLDPMREGLRKNKNPRPSRSAVRSKINNLDYEEFEDFEDDELVIFEKM